MSFASKTKNELTRIATGARCCQLAELSAIVRTSGTISLRGGGIVDLHITTENSAIARRIFTLIKKDFLISTAIKIEKKKNLKRGNAYHININKAGDILKKLGILIEKNGLYNIYDSISEDIVRKPCCIRSYIRGVFLGGGSISAPDKSYHLEFITHNVEYANALKELINGFGLNAKTIERRSDSLVYLKEGDQIVDLLNIIGAHQALLQFENVRIIKQMRNDVNRIVNCETANLNKTVKAAVRQIQDIQKIDERVGLEVLPLELAELARLRLDRPGASLKELGESLTNPIGKSGVNHRFKKISLFARGLDKIY